MTTANPRMSAGDSRFASNAPAHPPTSEATVMSAATWKFTFPLSVKSTHAVPFVRSASRILRAFACCMLDGMRIPIAASMRMPIPAPK